MVSSWAAVRRLSVELGEEGLYPAVDVVADAADLLEGRADRVADPPILVHQREDLSLASRFWRERQGEYQNASGTIFSLLGAAPAPSDPPPAM